MKYPVEEVILPRDLKGIENGKLPDKLLVKIAPGGVMHHLAAKAWTAMRAAAKADGVVLGHVGAYRPLAEQISLFEKRYSDKPTGRDITRKWKGKTYYLKPGVAPAGTPGTSNHGWGLAIDAAVIVGGNTLSITSNPDGKGGWASGLDWLLKNAATYGFSWEIKEGAQAEAWHIRYHAGDTLPDAVKGA